MGNHEKIKMKYGDTYKKVVNILLKHDPAGVFYGEHENTDEYNPEVSRILLGLENCHSEADALMLVRKTFVEMFGDSVAGGQEKYLPIAEEIWRVWKIKNEP